MLGLDFVLASSARNASETGAYSWGGGHANRANRESSVSSFLYGNGGTQVSEIGDFVFGAVGSFTDDSTLSAARKSPLGRSGATFARKFSVGRRLDFLFKHDPPKG